MLFPDARVVFAEDGPEGPMFIRYNDILYTWQEFVFNQEQAGLSQDFIIPWAKSLTLELI